MKNVKNRQKTIEELKKKGQYVSYDTKFEYCKRLIKRFDGNRAFIFDYVEGSGSELAKKFWSVISSSRYAFELYSWMANEDECNEFKDIHFEYKLETIKHSPAPSNMDVYFQRNNRTYFIESKFTETVKLNIKKDLSASYYKSKPEGNKYDLCERYYEEKIADEVSDFIIKQKDICEQKYENLETYFDAKQEITHLVAIINYIRKKYEQLKNSENVICFYNVLYEFDDFEKDAAKEFIEQFKKKANDLVKKLFPDVNFVYDIKTVQQFMEELGVDLKSKKAFGTGNTVFEQLQQFEI